MWERTEYYVDSDDPTKKIKVQDVSKRNLYNKLDFFAIHFEEELSGINGDVLNEETVFVNECINYILHLYTISKKQSSQLPTSVIIVGHSMGGFVARNAFTIPNYRTGNIQFVTFI
jgi:glycosylphosphatidylinositol deacylase